MWLSWKSLNLITLFSLSNFSLPWNQSTCLGYFGETIYSIPVGEAYLIANVSILTLFLVFCIHIEAFSEIFTDMIVKWNQHSDATECNEGKSIVDLIRFYLLVKKWVQPGPQNVFQWPQNFHSRFRWFLQTAEIYSPLILIQLGNSMFVIALVLFQLDLVNRLAWLNVSHQIWKIKVEFHLEFRWLETPTTWLCGDSISVSRIVGDNVSLLLFRQIGIGKLRRNVWFSLQPCKLV